VPFLYHEIFIEEVYTRHGVTLDPDSVVVDIGANIGLFGMYAAMTRCTKGVVVCVEPVPEIFTALQANLARVPTIYSESTARVRALNCGVSDGTTSTAEFTFYPGAAGWSTMYPDHAEVEKAVQAYVEEALPLLKGLERNPLTLLGQAIARTDNPSAKRFIRTTTKRSVNRMLGTAQTVQCQLMSVSQIMAQEQLTVVDLLKVDVERAELEVLAGVEPDDWQRIRQVVLEVHDVDGRLAEVIELLRTCGFSHVRAHQPSAMTGSNLWNVFALREPS